jgi:FG-GAP repeat
VAAGDVNGDGKADVVVTAPSAATSQHLANQGRILIFSGADGSLIRRIDGEKATEQLGESVALADVNGDGHADLLAGAWSYDPGSGGTNKNNGIFRLYDGATGAVLFEHIGTERAEGMQDEMGRAVAFGDVDGDGALDLILGAGGGPGYVEVISGADFSTRLYLFRGDLGVGNEDQCGRAVAAADLNGDGKAEVIAAAHVGDGGGLGDSGWVRVFDGATGALLHQFNGTSAQDHFGTSVAVGDVDGDGHRDVIVGAEWGTLAGVPPGAGYVRAFKGLTDTVLLEFHGSCDSDHLGTSVAVHDVDAKGKVHILAGAPDGDANAVLDNGYVRLYQDTF